ncbi:MAG: hypothetical protein UMV23_06990 [Halanaerobium sp.]|nr:hypothetical protein [Halanaerobium sp.]
MDNQQQLDRLEQRLDKINEALREAIEYSVSIRTDKQMKRETTDLWKAFMGEFIGDVKKKSRESGDNLLAGFGFPGIFF